MMLEKKVEQLLEQLQTVESSLSDPEVVRDQKKFRELTQEHARLCEIRHCHEQQTKTRTALKDCRLALTTESHQEMLQLLELEIATLTQQMEDLDETLNRLLVPPNPTDHANTILEVRAGTGGDEAALFVGDLVRMYRFFADRMGWKVEVFDHTESEAGGFKEFVMVVSGANVYRTLQHEAGTHRVQRVPATESQGRIHTSAVTVACLIEPPEDEEIALDEKELRIDTMRSSGAGGQHVNTTDSAVRITHIPTKIVVRCEEEKSQHKNKQKALRLLQAKIKEHRDREQRLAISSTRSSQVGSGDRSERIRTYNFPQSRVTDHRIQHTSHNLEGILRGELEEFSHKLVQHAYEQQLHEA